MFRKALIIGNTNYDDKPLETPMNDAMDMASILKKKEFEISVNYDLTIKEMDRSILNFVDSIKTGKNIALFYFAGHGIQIDGKNYLMPVGETFFDESSVKYGAYSLLELLERLEINKNNINIIILDACRNNPFDNSRSSSSSGLAEIFVSKGTFIAFATAPGRTASDTSNNSRNGLYTSHLLDALNIVGLSLDERFKLIRENVFQESKEKQLPWVSNSIIGDFYFDTKYDKTIGLPTVFQNVSKFEIAEYTIEDDFNQKYIKKISSWNELIIVLETLCDEGHSERPFCLEVIKSNGVIEPLVCVTCGGKIDYGYSMVTIEEFLNNNADYGCFSNSYVLDTAKKAPKDSELYYSINWSDRIIAKELISYPTILWNIHTY